MALPSMIWYCFPASATLAMVCHSSCDVSVLVCLFCALGLGRVCALVSVCWESIGEANYTTLYSSLIFLRINHMRQHFAGCIICERHDSQYLAHDLMSLPRQVAYTSSSSGSESAFLRLGLSPTRRPALPNEIKKT